MNDTSTQKGLQVGDVCAKPVAALLVMPLSVELGEAVRDVISFSLSIQLLTPGSYYLARFDVLSFGNA